MAQWRSRHTRRYPIAAPACFWWSCADESMLAGEGITRDISGDGVLVAATLCPPEGARVRLEIRLSRFKGRGNAMELHGEGFVVRVEAGERAIPGEGTSGFAASVQFYPARADMAEELRDCAAEKTEATYLN